MMIIRTGRSSKNKYQHIGIKPFFGGFYQIGQGINHQQRKKQPRNIRPRHLAVKNRVLQAGKKSGRNESNGFVIPFFAHDIYKVNCTQAKQQKRKFYYPFGFTKNFYPIKQKYLYTGRQRIYFNTFVYQVGESIKPCTEKRTEFIMSIGNIKKIIETQRTSYNHYQY